MAATKALKKWIAKLIDKDGNFVRNIPTPWAMPPAVCPGFVEFEKGVLQYGGDSAKQPRRRFDQSKIVRSDERLTIIEYKEVDVDTKKK